MTSSGKGKRAALLASAATLALVALGGTALAGHVDADVDSYTGCLVAGDGVLVKIKEGNSPKSPCTGGQVEAHFSGGDTTAITAQTGGGLVGGGTNGAASLSLRRDCSSGQVVKWNGSAWVCASDSNSTYTAGTGLDLTGSMFSVEPDYRVKNTSDCSSGEFATGFESDGDIQCAAPPTTAGVRAYFAAVGNVVIGGPTAVLSKALPAGTYLLSATVEIKNKDADSPSAMDYCSIPGYSTTEPIKVDDGGSAFVSLSSAVTHTGGNVVLTCDEFVADVDVASATLSAILVGSLG